MSAWELPDGEETPRPCDFPVALLSGVAVYTTFCLPISESAFLAHMARLKQNAQAIGLIWRHDERRIRVQVSRVVPAAEPVVRLTAYAEVAAFGDLFKSPSLPCRLMLSTRPCPPAARDPVALKTLHYVRSFPTVKWAGIGELIHFRRQAVAQGYQDLLLINGQNCITEASTANFFALDEAGVLRTPDPERDGCLPGITRQQVLDLARTLQIPVSSGKPLALTELQSCRAAFLTNAVQGLVRVGRIDDDALPWPEPANALYQTLFQAWENLAAKG